MDAALKDRISEMIASEPVFLFLKGEPSFPQCGFSNQVVQILKAFNVKFGHANVLEDPAIRQGIKEYSDWPTIPQLYINGEFIGGCDIVREAWASGELQESLQKAFPDLKITPPRPPSKPRDISPQEAKDLMGGEETLFLDVRTEEEREIARVDHFELLDQEKLETIMAETSKDTPLVFMCHFGGRSRQAADYFSQQGFQKVYNVIGGIDNWSQTVDDEIPRY